MDVLWQGTCDLLRVRVTHHLMMSICPT